MTDQHTGAALVARPSTAAAIRSEEVALIVKHINRMSEKMPPLARLEVVMIAADIAMGRHRAALEPSDKWVGNVPPQ